MPWYKNTCTCVSKSHVFFENLEFFYLVFEKAHLQLSLEFQLIYQVYVYWVMPWVLEIFWAKIWNQVKLWDFINYWMLFLCVRLDIRTHLMVHYQISSDVYLVNLRIKSDIESSEGIWHSSDIYLTPFWRITDSVHPLLLIRLYFKIYLILYFTKM